MAYANIRNCDNIAKNVMGQVCVNMAKGGVYARTVGVLVFVNMAIKSTNAKHVELDFVNMEKRRTYVKNVVGLLCAYMEGTSIDAPNVGGLVCVGM